MTLFINDALVELNSPPDTLLLWAIREELRLTGTRYGCGEGLCGSCTVLLDGNPARSCVLTVGNVAGKKITTIEGIPETHPIIQAWQRLQVPQCGYCQSGQILSAISLLSSNPKPSESQIVQAMEGNLCRCGTYMRIKKAITEVASGGVA